MFQAGGARRALPSCSPNFAEVAEMAGFALPSRWRSRWGFPRLAIEAVRYYCPQRPSCQVRRTSNRDACSLRSRGVRRGVRRTTSGEADSPAGRRGDADELSTCERTVVTEALSPDFQAVEPPSDLGRARFSTTCPPVQKFRSYAQLPELPATSSPAAGSRNIVSEARPSK